MTPIKIVSASAGSGKTTRLARVLEEAITSGEVRPDAVVATTFTTKAAAELAERARRQLLRAGRIDDAHRLNAARIGTVNSVCDRLVSEFAFELGLPPRLRVLEERLAAEQLSRAMAGAMTPEVSRELTRLARRMDSLDWQSDVRRVIESCRSNGIAAEDLDECARRSVAAALRLFGTPTDCAEALDQQLEGALSTFIETCSANDDATKKSQAAVKRARSALGLLRSRGWIAWREWAALAGLGVGKRSRDCVDPLHEAAAAHDRHPLLRADLERAIALVFEVARRTLGAYQALKRDWGVIDFVDQEVLALQLLRRDSVKARMRGEIDLVLVDEFQDTSPLQLAIFLELAKIAPRNVWVGDQKQAIYGFRGTDPALMNAALEEFLQSPDPALVDEIVDEIVGGGTQPETLSVSYRSRPELVRLTSDIFARAFAAHGLPEERVRLEPARDDEPPGLGPIVEYWPLILDDRRVKSRLRVAVAEGVRRMVSDPEQLVRDPGSGSARSVRAGDVAVLCRTNAQCADVAAALEALDIRAVVARAGLFETAEGRLALSALRLWLDRGDTLAAAELARVVDYPDRPDAWLADVLRASEGDTPIDRCAVVAAVREAAAASGDAGPLEALDGAMNAVGLRCLCNSWGDAERRLANLDAIRAHAARYVAESAAAGTPPTVSGLVAYFATLCDASFGRQREDDQAIRRSDEAVCVMTWHRAKGLEWPVTVLFGLERQRERDALGVNVVSDRDRFQIDDPLGGRWIRYLPTPYHWNQRRVPFVERLAHDAQCQRLQQESRREALRLLYVGWTRARDRLVLAAEQKGLFSGILRTLREIDPELIDTPMRRSVWAGREVAVTIRPTKPGQAPPPTPSPGAVYPERDRPDHPPAYVAPSSLAADTGAAVGAPVELGAPLAVAEAADYHAIGNALHRFLAGDQPARAASERLADARRLAHAWGADPGLPADEMIVAGDALDRWLAARWPGARRRREWPLLHRLPSKTIVRGTPDLVLERDDALVIIDHKCIGGDKAEVTARAQSFAGQLVAYRDALRTATGKPVSEMWIHLPLNALAVPVVVP